MIVGLSSNVIAGGGLDGIGVYTSALDRELRKAGVDVRRIGTPRLSRAGLRAPGNPDLAFPAPLTASIGSDGAAVFLFDSLASAVTSSPEWGGA